jgi:hypothetical protein
MIPFAATIRTEGQAPGGNSKGYRSKLNGAESICYLPEIASWKVNR